MIELMPTFQPGQRLTAEDLNRAAQGIREVQSIQGDQFLQVTGSRHGLTIRLNLAALLPVVQLKGEGA